MASKSSRACASSNRDAAVANARAALEASDPLAAETGHAEGRSSKAKKHAEGRSSKENKHAEGRSSKEKKHAEGRSSKEKKHANMRLRRKQTLRLKSETPGPPKIKTEAIIHSQHGEAPPIAEGPAVGMSRGALRSRFLRSLGRRVDGRQETKGTLGSKPVTSDKCPEDVAIQIISKEDEEYWLQVR